MFSVDKYFDRSTFAGLVFLMPSTIVIISILLRAVDSEILIRALFDVKRIFNPYIFMNIASLLSLLVCFTDIIRINGKKVSSGAEELFIYRKSFLNLSIIFVSVSYILFIYLYYDLEKLGNIPVGRN